MSPDRVSVLSLPTPQDLADELARLGAQELGAGRPAAVGHLAPDPWEEADLRLLRVHSLAQGSAEALRRAVSACGGSVLGASEEGGRMVLSITQAELRRLIPWLLGSSADLIALADELRRLLVAPGPEPSGPKADPTLLPVPWGELSVPAVMGILNVTPDSFSDGALYSDTEAAVRRAQEIAEEGAQLLDLGGESTRPGARPVDEDEELSRVLPVLRALGGGYPLPISLDTRRAGVAARGVEAGVRVLNDVSGLRHDPELARVAAANDTVLVLMHSRGTPDTMQSLAVYEDLLAEVRQELLWSVETALAAGVRPEQIWLDPGIGFAKTAQHNLELLRRLEEIVALGYPVLIGTSRKRFLGLLTGVEDPKDRLEGTAATCALAIQSGAAILRVHDVRAMVRVATVTAAVLGLPGTR